MATKSKARQVKKVLRNADDIIHLFTGKRLKNIVGTGINIFGEELARKAAGVFSGPEEPDLPPDSPYNVLGVHPEAMDVVVKGAYRALAREYHPDTGTKPDTAKFQAATEAYNAILAERQARKEQECAPKN
ncbi:MAG: DnaJ domain-containing protein [Dehalococcoidales bacterium]|nr:DnaJ domain-containing protein [Dehalococcoidales bacterium]